MASAVCPVQSGVKNANWAWPVRLQRDVRLSWGRNIRGYKCPLSESGGASEGAAQGRVWMFWGLLLIPARCDGMGVECPRAFLMLLPSQAQEQTTRGQSPKGQGQGQE